MPDLTTWAADLGGDRHVNNLIDELRESLALRGLIPADVDHVEDALREVLYAERA